MLAQNSFTIKKCILYRIILTGTYCCVSSFGFAGCFTLDAWRTEFCLGVQLIIRVGLVWEFKITVRNY